jgi:Ca2+/Na+ antiporter
VLGSNVFDGLFIVGLAAAICPIQVAAREVGWALGLASSRWLSPFRTGTE